MDRKKLVNESIDYIMQHLDGELSFDTVAAHFYISKYHFSRIFKEETGESVYSFIKRCKVDQSAIDMKLNPMKAITDIGLDPIIVQYFVNTTILLPVCSGNQYQRKVCLFHLLRRELFTLKLRKNMTLI